MRYSPGHGGGHRIFAGVQCRRCLREHSENPRLFLDCFAQRLDDAPLYPLENVSYHSSVPSRQGIEVHFRGRHKKREVARRVQRWFG